MPGYLIIDGYNAINKIKEVEAKKDISLEASRMFFIKMLIEFMDRKRIFDKILVVFDSKDKELGVRRYAYANVEALFATNDRSADSVIVELLRDSSPEDKISVCSDDNFVRNHAKVFGRDVISVQKLKDIIILKKKNIRAKMKERDLDSNKIKNINEELKTHWGLR